MYLLQQPNVYNVGGQVRHLSPALFGALSLTQVTADLQGAGRWQMAQDRTGCTADSKDLLMMLTVQLQSPKC